MIIRLVCSPLDGCGMREWDWEDAVYPTSKGGEANMDMSLLFGPNDGRHWIGNFVREFSFDGPKVFANEFVIRKGQWKTFTKYLDLDAAVIISLTTKGGAGKLARACLNGLLAPVSLQADGGITISDFLIVFGIVIGCMP